jgi:hypothetical protein
VNRIALHTCYTLALAALLSVPACTDGRGTSCAGGACDASVTAPDGCIPSCADRECGPDPVCGLPCGSCADGACADGRCTSPDAPIILSWATSSDRLTPTRPLTISVVVTDPGGIDDLVGGTLLDDTGRAYGTFATEASEGSYSYQLTWGHAEGIESIVAPPTADTVERRLVARFFDVAGHVIERQFVLTLACDEAGESPCGGSCIDRRENGEHCGACGFSCGDPSWGDSYCYEGVCVLRVRRYDSSVTDKSCARECELHGTVCDAELAAARDETFFAGYGETDCLLRADSCDTVFPATRECASGVRERESIGCTCRRDVSASE